MKGIPLWQPWADLVVMGAKRIETRHWPAPASLLSEPVAIYASKTRGHLSLCSEPPFERYVGDRHARALGALVGTVVIERCTAMRQDAIDRLVREHPAEYAFGYYKVGRYAWVLRDPVRFLRPVEFKWPVRGPAKWVHVPDELVAGAAPAPGVAA